jgi:regulator of replication initiation timing
VKLDTQVKTYQDELSDLKKALSSEMEKLTLDFQELRTTLQKQQDDVAASLLNLDITYAQLQ